MTANIQARQANADKARVFFALWPNPALRRALHALALQCRQTHGGRAMEAQTLHLTLLFLGEMQRTRIARLQQAIDGFEFEAFSFLLQQLACWRHNRIAYAAPADHAAALHRLADALRQRAGDAGIGCDERPFSPHVTLLRKVTQPVDTQAIQPLEWRVEAFSLVESAADAQAVRYRTLQTWRCLK